MSAALTPTREPRIAMIPFTLAVGPQEVNPPGQKRKTVWILHLQHKARLADFLRVAMTPGVQFQLASPAAQTPEEAAKEEPPEDLAEQIEEVGAREDPQSISTPEGVRVTPGATPPATPAGATSAPAQPEQKPPAKKAETRGAKTETKQAPAETKPAGKTEPAKRGRPPNPKPPERINIEKMALEILGPDSMTTFVMPEMVRLFGEKARLPDLDGKQLETLAESIQKEKLVRKSVIAFPSEDEPQRLALRKQLNSTLKAKFDGDVDRCVGWLKELYNTTTSETLSLAELKVALERSKETEPGAEPDFPLF
jgi:hypothetical protein